MLFGLMTELAGRKCESCAPGTPPLEGDRVEALRSELHGDWQLDGGRIVRELKLPNFRDAFALATKIALLAEEQGHHPDLEVGWGRVKVALTTHSVKGLSENDFIMAAKIDTFV